MIYLNGVVFFIVTIYVLVGLFISFRNWYNNFMLR